MFRLLTFGSVLWAFMMLAATGALQPWILVLFPALLFGAVYRERIGISHSPMIWRLINLMAMCAAGYGWFVLQQRLDTVVYLFLYLTVNKLWTAQKQRDFLQLYALGFFMVLAASVSTASISFAPMVMVYMLLMIATLLVFTLRRDSEAAFNISDKKRRATEPETSALPFRLKGRDRERLLAVERRPFRSLGLVRFVSSGTFLVILVALGLFFVIPRIEAGTILQGLSPVSPPQRRSGFADSVNLGGVGAIESDPMIVMRVSPMALPGGGMTEQTSFIRLRGATLEVWDGRRWEKSFRVSSVAVTQQSVNGVTFRSNAGSNIAARHQIILEPDNTPHLFGPTMPARYEFADRTSVVVDELSRVLRLQRPPSQVMTYSVESRVPPDPRELRPEASRAIAAEPPADFLAAAAGAIRAQRRLAERLFQTGSSEPTGPVVSGLSTDLVRVLTDIPEDVSTATIRTVAAEWTGTIREKLEIAIEIERRLSTDFQYSLDTTDFTNRTDHMEQFLTNTRRGHCEYFATAMVLLLRAREIPARVVNGYLSDEWSDASGGYFVVRQENAHSWVEAWIEPHGWLTFDPTPADGLGSRRVPDSFYRKLTRSLDAIKLLWYRYVVDFDVTGQRNLLANLTGGRSTRFRTWSFLRRMDNILGDLGSQVAGGSRNAGLLIVVSIGMLFTGFLLWRELHRWLAGRKRLRSAEANGGRPPTVTIEPFLALLRALEEWRRRREAETPMEYARHVAIQWPQLDALPVLTERYYRSRYDGVAWTPAETRAAQELLAAIQETTAPREPFRG